MGRGGEGGRTPVVTLRLSDWTGFTTAVFDPKELEAVPEMQFRLKRVWGSLLRVRSHKQLADLIGASRVQREPDMPSRTLEDKVEDLTKITSTTTSRVDRVEDDVAKVISEHGDTARSVVELKIHVPLLNEQVAELRTWRGASATDQVAANLEIALLKVKVEELRSWRDEARKQQEEWSRKLWMIVPPVIAAILSSVLTAWATYFLRR